MRLRGCVACLICVFISVGPEREARSQSPAARDTAKTVWVRVRVKGMIGEDFTSDSMRLALRRARAAKAAVIVLELDTPGGHVDHAEEIVNTIIRSRGVRFVAVVKQALSAGSAITLACRDVYVTETATIGAATSYFVDSRGIAKQLPKDVAEKFQSAWRAVCRKAAQHGGHSALLADAMIDMDFSLSMKKVRGKIVLTKGTDGKVLKRRGRVLTLTAREAVACGLAKGIVTGADALGAKLGVRGWREYSGPAVGDSVSATDSLGGLYELMSAKAAELKLNNASALTPLQRNAALKRWDRWLERQRLQGRKIRWDLRLVESIDVPVSEAESLFKRRTSELSQARKALQRSPGNKYVRNMVRDRQKRLAEARKQLDEMKAYPFFVGGTATDHPGYVVVMAKFGKSSGGYLAGAHRGTVIPLSGQIQELRFGTIRPAAGPRGRGRLLLDTNFGPSRDRKMYMYVWLKMCSVDASRTVSGDGGIGPSDSDEKKAAGLLKIAAMYDANNKPKLARATLKGIVEDYPKTKAAAKARLELGIVDEPKK